MTNKGNGLLNKDLNENGALKPNFNTNKLGAEIFELERESRYYVKLSFFLSLEEDLM